uniref:Secreted frizzled-related protein C HduSFRPc n=1 Tax=Halisarca dujardinii TaxID=2583056 RepID=A0A8F8ASV3_HALDU|nr:secreted frizzled-related protein C HduSFRPc [Halisarca dujardinii]
MAAAYSSKRTLLFAIIVFFTSVCQGSLTYGIQCVANTDQNDFCYHFPFQHSAIPNLGGGFDSGDIEQELRSFSQLYSLGCSNALVQLLCSYYKPPCFPMEDFTIRLPPCQELCVYVRSTCEPTLKSYGRSWPDILDCSRFPSSCNTTLCFPPYVSLDQHQAIPVLPVPRLGQPPNVKKGSVIRMRGWSCARDVSLHRYIRSI